MDEMTMKFQDNLEKLSDAIEDFIEANKEAEGECEECQKAKDGMEEAGEEEAEEM